MKRLLTILLIAISAVASAQTYQLNYPDIRIGSSNTGKIVLRGSNVQFPFLGLGSITDSVVTIVGGVFKKVPRSQFSGGGSSYTFNNGLTNTAGVVGLGGDAFWGFPNYISFSQSTDNGGEFVLSTDLSQILYRTPTRNGSFSSTRDLVNSNETIVNMSTNYTGSSLSRSIYFGSHLSNKITISDLVGSAGAYYANDYSIGRTFPTDNLWIPNAGWVLDQISSGGTPYTASNGLKKVGNDFQLGGNYSSAIQVGNLSNGTLALGPANGLVAINNISGGFSSVGVGNTSSFVSYGNGTQINQLNISSTAMEVVDEINSKGLVYQNNYGANFTARSLVDKGYVDSVAAASGGGGGAVSSVFGRTGAVTAQSSDYNAFYPLLASTYNNPTWINTLAYSKITGVPSFITTETDPTVPAYAKTLTAFSVIKASTDPLYLPITYTPDTAVYRTVLNSFTKAQTNTQISNAIAAYTPASQVDNDLSASTTRAPSKTAVNTALALKENTANKQNSLTADGSGIKFPTVDAVNAGLATKGSGTVTSFSKTDGIGITSSVANATTTPNLSIAVDTTTIRTAANSYTLAALQTKLNNYLTTVNASATYVPLTRTVSTGNGLSGGGALSGNLTLIADTSILATKANTKTLAQLQTTFNTKQATLVSGTNIKTINGNTILGSGDLVIGGSAPDTTVYRTVANSRSLAQTQTALNLKVDKTTTLTAGYGINTLGDLSTGRTVSVDTTSSNGVVSKSRLTASLGNFNVTSAFTGLGTVASPFDLALVSIAKGGTNNTTYTTGGLLKYDGTKFASALAADVPTLNQNTTGSAASLTTTRTIWGQNFNGTANVTGALSGATTIGASGIITGSSFTGAGTGLTGTAASLTAGNATKLATARTIGTTGITSTAASFDGSANVNIAVTAVPGTVVTGNITGKATGTTLQDVTTAGNTTGLPINVQGLGVTNTLSYDTGIGIIGTTSNHPLSLWSNNAERARILPNGNTLIGTTTDNTVDKLQVNGSISATNLTAGTYTPTGTITDVSGTVTSITPLLTHYSRIGNQVNVSGAVTFNTTTTSTSVTIELTLPIASNMTGGDDAWGTGTVPIPITNYSANSGVTANPTTDKAKLTLNTLSGTFTLYYQYMYTIK